MVGSDSKGKEKEKVRKEVKEEGLNFKEDLTEQEIYQAIKDVIIEYLEKNPKSAYKLSQELGLSEHVIPDFIKPNSKKQSISSDAIISLADYLNMELDEMIGRVVRHQGVEALSPDMRDEVKSIREGLKGTALSRVTTSSPADPAKPLSHVEKLQQQKQQNSKNLSNTKTR